ncbi:MAG: hypothetical protein EBT83_18680, partial [Betaproteobacteria bacterium]|nr:hypothetical protein [Betaproteobacteria bacterium]
GVAIKIVTGDSALVTRHVCQQLQIPVLGLLTGQEIAALDDLAEQSRRPAGAGPRGLRLYRPPPA